MEQRTDPDGPDATLANLSRVPLEKVFHGGDSALDNAMRRLLVSAREQGENYAAHGTTPTP